MADHLVSESLYIRDPDHIGIEIYSDRPSQQWQWADGGSRVQMSTERLDTEGLLKEAAAAGKGGWWKAMPAGTTIGHVHLHVSNLGKATRFYSGALGLDLTCEFPGARFFAADKYHHHIATNTWLGTGVLPALPGGLGLDHFGIELPSAQAFADTTDHMMRSGYAVVVEEEGMPPQGKGALLHDADNIAIRLYYCHRHGQRQ
jgi:catechol 2,3-dioxygenase